MSLLIATKSLATGYDTMMILGPKDCYQRLTNLPNNWRKARIALVASLTTASSDNGNPSSETISSAVSSSQMAIGFSNGTGSIGQATNYFVGIMNNLATFQNQYVYSGSGGYNLSMGPSSADSINFVPTIGSGSTIYQPSSFADNMYALTASPTSSTSFCFYWAIDIDVSVVKTLIVKAYDAINKSDTSNTALLTMYNQSYTEAWNNTGASGWWSGSNAPVNCQYIYIRWPFSNNQLRIHNMAVMQLA